ncbi:hypothetical protein FXF51_06160 [Nonomuraea sp. PA05]|uniref:hypothetical protein n=1 Tax=Nonomuraea sp. PA05 TaxID=2604466 RepID=UPI0011D376DD|nr:hypothetical protein [Nonomuraea sp. PA05]TYB69744.1 hypothetical protein FXF51_06160 [Nonomuraea sp. PA05]
MLLGRQRRSVTVYEYEDGRLARSVTTHDAEWLGEDLGYAKGQRRNDLDKCPGCGLPLSETTDPENEGRYEAPPPMRCHACTPLEHRKGEYTQSPPGLLFRVYLKVKKTLART